MARPYILAYDLGTTGNKATIFDTRGDLVGSAFKSYETIYSEPGWAEQRPSDWWDSVVCTTRSLLEKTGVLPKDIEAIGISGHMMGCLPVDGEGEPLANSIIHADSRSAGECGAIEREVGSAAVYKITGQRLDPHYPLTKAMWFRKHAPELFSKTSLFIQCKDHIVFRLTGKLGTTDFSDATLSGLYDINSMTWSEELIHASGVGRELLPDVLPSSRIVGGVSSTAAAATGLCQGIPVVAGAGDGACATLGAGVTTVGGAYNYLGGSSWIATLVEKPVIDPAMRLFSMGDVEYGRFCVIGTIQSAGSSYQWLADQICQKEKEEAIARDVSRFELMDDLATQSIPGSRRLFFLPYMMGERAPIWDPNARGVLLGLTLSHSRADVIRAVLEGVAYALNTVLDAMTDLKIDVKSLRAIGGGAKSDLWLGILSSVYGKTLLIPEHLGEATSLGAALIAGVGVGLFSDFAEAGAAVRIVKEKTPDTEWAGKYTEFHRYYKTLYPVLKESYKRLSELGS